MNIAGAVRIIGGVGRVGAADDVGDESSDSEGEGDDGEADEGVEDGIFGFLELAGVTRRGNITDAAD